MQVRSNDIELFYETVGDGPPIVFLHPFPVNHNFWKPVADALSTRYRIVLPDLRAHGQSGVGEGAAATMQKHADDVARLCDELKIGRATFVGCSIGGYILFEFWRRFRERVNALALWDTKAAADIPEARANRLQSAEQVMERGSEQFVDAMLEKLLGESTRRNRPDIVDDARRMMLRTSKEGVAAAQRGMAERSDSVATLATITVPTLVVVGEEDTATPMAEAQVMLKGIRGSELRTVPRAGHYAAFERPEDASGILREFLGKVQHRL
jgi:3-oxoadipate enol-lactonase